MELKEHADLYLTARKIYEVAKKASDDAEKAWRQVEADMIAAMLDKKEKSFKMPSGLSFGLSERFSISVTQANDDQVRGWLVENEGDDTPFLVETCSKAAVTKLVKKLVEENRQDGDPDNEGIPDFLNLKTSPTLSCRGR